MIICNFPIAFPNQKCYNIIIQFLFAWDLSYPTLFQSIAVFADLFLFPFLFPRRFPLRGVVFLFPINNTIFTQNVREKNISARPCGRTQKIHRQEAYSPPVDFIYIASLLNRHGISCNPCHAVKARHCLVCHAAPRVMVPDSRGCGSVRVKRRNTPCLGDCQENTTLSGGDQPPSPRKSSGLVDDCRLRPVCLSVSKGEQYIAFSSRNPLSNLGTAYSGTPPNIGTRFQCRVSAAGYLPQRRKITS